MSINVNSEMNEIFFLYEKEYSNENILNIPKLEWYPKYYDFGYIQNDGLYYTNFEIWNNGTDIMFWTLNVRNDWINVNPSSGYSLGEHDIINVSINTTNLDLGQYEAKVYIHSEGDYIFYTYFILSESKLEFNPKIININNLEKNDKYQIEIEIWNNGSGILNWYIESNSSFIKLFPSNGSSNSTHDIITIQIDTNNLKSGEYFEIIKLYSDGGKGILKLNFTVNNPPVKPLIDGENILKYGKEYLYNITSYDLDGDNVSYYIDWGDNISNNWSIFLPNNQTYFVNKTWNKKGIFIIKVKAKDIYNLESEWSTLEVKVPIIKFFQNTFFNNLNKKFALYLTYFYL